MDYSNKVALVTGGANGIGKAVAEAFMQAGASVVAADIDRAGGALFEQEGLSKGLKAHFYPIDLTSPGEIETMFSVLSGRLGKIDILVNNAGKGNFKPLYDVTVEEWDEVIHLNLRATFLTSREFARQNRGTDYGRIINIASTRFLMSEPGNEAYSASKGGIVSLTHALALSLASENITVNCISPGWIETRNYEALSEADHRQHPSARVGRPADIARACLFLAEEDNDFLNAQNIIIDGGMTKKMIYCE